MIQLYNKQEISAETKRTPEDVFSGDGVTQEFSFYNLNPDILARVFLDSILQVTNTDFYTYWIYPAGTSWIFFYTPPIFGSSNIILQGSSGLFFPGGSTQSGYLNGYNGDNIDICFWLSNDNILKYYTGLTIVPIDIVPTEDETSWIKLATTQAGLDSAVAGASLSYPDINDSDTLHPLWIRVTVPPGYLGPDVSIFNKTDISFSISYTERDA